MKQVLRLTAAVVFATAMLSGCVQSPRNLASAQSRFSVEIRRTQDGIPHIKADDWASLGYGYGYVQAQDNLCTLADGFVTFRGERSSYFGADAHPPSEASFGQPRNLQADFFFRFVDDSSTVERYKSAQSAPIRELMDGFVAGYNRYVDELDAGRMGGANAECKGKPWVGKITSDDMIRRLVAANLAGGAARFLPQIAHAQPPAKHAPSAPGVQTGAVDIAPSQLDIGGRRGIGSNALAFGAPVTQEGRSLLFGNPHWFWRGPDRFYEVQLTIPGQLNVAGVSFLGVPVVMIGFNNDIAWTHTVSSARRFGIFQLSLDPADPTRYVYHGVSEPMTHVPVTVQTRNADGSLTSVTRTLYRSRFGPLVDLSSMSPALAWNAQHAFALRDVNTDNTRSFENFLLWDQARSLDDFIAIQKRLAATPWVNTLAIGRDDPRAWFADLGAVPDVPDSLAAACTTPLGRAFDAKAPGVPFLDGSKSACGWRVDASSAQPGALPVAEMPSMARGDYVGNFNGSYWLTNANAPMTGYPNVAGITGTEQSLRTRFGHTLAAELQVQKGGVTRLALETKVLDSQSMSEQLFRKPILDTVCADESDSVVSVTQGMPGGKAQTVDLGPACKVLREWDGTANTNARGANLWDEFWRRLDGAGLAHFYRVPFDPAAPLATPRGLDVSNPALKPALQQALGGAVLAMQRYGFALDSTRGELLHVERNGERVPLFGGCDDAGYFTVMCAVHPLDAGGYAIDRSGHGESYLQVVSFDANGVQADTMLAHSESDDPASPHFSDATRRFAGKQWLRFPFTEEAIAADPGVTTVKLQAPR
ncbi:penicillin amidase [Caballeronia udeis]|uniref:Penicillin amidase n=1 Tax=Caballeronia udeis TaxID=1232866 RepID=A0A158GN84_9BURK|nr:penicillin acylase family protein [Caballeronia udeis]SAL33281.1 penicillin amidase [Caballeronia udeis]